MTDCRFLKFARGGLMALLALATALRLEAGPGQSGNASLSGYFLPGFGVDGYKAWDIQGRDSQANTVGDTQAEISDMLLRLYSHEMSPAKVMTIKLEMSIKSVHATVKTTPGASSGASTTVVSGSDILYITGVNDSYSVTGYDWRWESKENLIHLGRNVVVTFTSATTADKGQPNQPAHPIIILSDQLDIKQLPDTAQEPGRNQFTFTGNVSITDKETQTDPNGEFHTTCDNLVIIATRAATSSTTAPTTSGEPSGLPASLAVGRVESIVAHDNVVSRQGSIEVRGGQGELYPADEKVVMSQSPQVRVELSGNTTETTNYALLEGGTITWQRDQQVMDMAPVAGAPEGQNTVKVSLPSNSPPRPGTTEARIEITGEALHMAYSPTERSISMDKSVWVKDPRYTIQAQHLDAQFDPPAEANTAANPPAVAPSSNPLVENTAPRLGQLKHLTVNGGVSILQTNLQATTERADVSPADDIISLSGSPHVVDTLSNATIDASTIKLAMNGDQATVLGERGQPARVMLPSLPVDENSAINVATTILSNRVAMERNEKSSSFIFGGNVDVTASSLEMSSGELDVYTNNLPAAAGADPTQHLQIVQMVAQNHVLVKQPGYIALAATAEVNPQARLNQNSTAVTPTTAAQNYRFIQLKGDPDGVTGPKRPEVDVVLPKMDAGTIPGSKKPMAAETTAKITSDDQWLFTSPTANTYVFSGNVVIDCGFFTMTCDLMQVNCLPAKTPDSTTANTGIQRLMVDNIVAEHNVRIVQGDNGEHISTADRAVINPREGKGMLSGNAVVKDDKKGSSLRNADIILTMTPGNLTEEALPPPATPGQPLQQPSITIPFDMGAFKNSSKKDSNAPAH